MPTQVVPMRIIVIGMLSTSTPIGTCTTAIGVAVLGPSITSSTTDILRTGLAALTRQSAPSEPQRALLRRLRPTVGSLILYGLGFLMIGGALFYRSRQDTAGVSTGGGGFEGNPFEGLELDPALYGTETEEEAAALKQCFEEERGVRINDLAELPNAGYDDVYAYRVCAEDLGIASKILRFTPAERTPPPDNWVEDLNRRIAIEAECLEEMGWPIEYLPADKDGVRGIWVPDLDDSEKDKLEVDSDECHDRAHAAVDHAHENGDHSHSHDD